MKFIISIFIAAFISFALFAIMASLVVQEERYIEEVPDWAIVTIINKPEDTKIQRKHRTLDPPPKPAVMPTGIINQDKVETKTPIEHDINVPNLEVDIALAPQEFDLKLIQDNGAQPIYRSLPRYPVEAARNKIKGWVKLSFSINRQGKAEDIVIIDSEPELIFDQAAIDALHRWKYKPMIEKGKTVKQEGLSVRLDFGK
ncbi:energy transducer TonB [Thalassomonas sp. M1454]|uniref:energy transducer TonB n=1 Tax=Thalassomonas sp. M1454 TaxID=2594477 RepID=UPI00163DA554|nr:energy transducer TonB [Thalassomonas sp. M1454]